MKGVDLEAAEGASIRDPIERELASLVNRSAASQVLCDPELRYLAVSEPYLAAFGLVRADVLGAAHFDVFPTLSIRWRDVYRRALEGDPYRSDLDLQVAENGSPQWLRISASQWRRSDGTVGGIMMSVEDVSAARSLRKLLDAKDSLLTTLLEVVRVGIALADEDGRFLYANASYRELFGYESDDLAGMYVGSAMHPDDAACGFGAFEPVLAGRDAIGEWRSRYTRKDGTSVLFDCVIASIPSAVGRSERFAVIARGATDRSDLERHLRQSDRLSAIGLLGEALAHDLGNLLPAFRGAVAGLRHSMARAPDPEAGMHSIEVVRGGTAYLEQLVEGLSLLRREPDASQTREASRRAPSVRRTRSPGPSRGIGGGRRRASSGPPSRARSPSSYGSIRSFRRSASPRARSPRSRSISS